MVSAGIKAYLRQFLKWLRLDLTLNLKYDRLTESVIRRVLTANDTAVDVGCHKGEILDILQRFAPEARHYCFEPLPAYFRALTEHYGNRHHIFPFALSDRNGSSSFQFVKNAPAYSGILKRNYDIANPEIETIQVELRKMDDVIPENTHIKLIKIDVEGAELSVIRGAAKTIKRCQPIIMFEFGLGASDVYGTAPDDIHDFFKSVRYEVYTLDAWLNAGDPLNNKKFSTIYFSKEEFYFLAAPEAKHTK